MKEKDVHTVSIKGTIHKACTRVLTSFKSNKCTHIKDIQKLQTS